MATNTKYGNQALNNNTTDGPNSQNSAFGIAALRDNNGTNNTAVGAYAGLVNTGNSNTALGSNALLQNTSGNYNTTVGAGSLCINAAGSSNTAIGTNAMSNSSTGSENTALGTNAGLNNLGSQNTFLGASTDAMSTYNSSTAIGYGAQIIGSNQIMMGTTGQTVVIPGSAILTGATTGYTAQSIVPLSYISSLIAGGGTAYSPTLAAVLASGNAAGSTGINMSDYGITNAKEISTKILQVRDELLPDTKGEINFEGTSMNYKNLEPTGSHKFITDSNGTPKIPLELGTTESTFGLPINMNTNSITGASTISATTFLGALTGNADTATSIAGGAAGNLLYQSATDVTAALGNGSNGEFLTFDGSIPTWSPAPTLSSILQAGNVGSTGINMSTNDITGVKNLSIDSGALTTLSTANYTPYSIVARQYVDSISSGIIPVEQCQCATTVNITLSGTQTIDDYSAVAGDRVLVKSQGSTGGIGTNYNTSNIANGIYVVGSTAWSRAANYTATDNVKGTITYVGNGTFNGNKAFVEIGDPAIVDADPLEYTVFYSNTFTAGNGLTVTGTVLDVDTQLSGGSNTPFLTFVGIKGSGDSGNTAYSLDTSKDVLINGLTVGKGANTQTSNTVVGLAALGATGLSGANNTALGWNALKANTTGNQNTAIGSASLVSNLSGIRNTVIGYQAMQYIIDNSGSTGGSYNTAVGYSTLRGNTGNTGGIFNTALGYNAGNPNEGNYNTFLGAQTDASANTWTNSTAIGYNAQITASNQIKMGTNTETVQIPGYLNTSRDALIHGLTVGLGAGSQTNTVVGASALASNISGDYNTAIGTSTLNKNTADNNTAVGRSALVDNISGDTNTAIGSASLRYNVSGSRNTAVGYEALYGGNTGNTNYSRNTAVGYRSLSSFSGNTAGSENTAIGFNAGQDNMGNSNTFLGAYTDADAITWSKSTALGYGARITASNQIMMGTTGESVQIPGYLNTSRDALINGLTVGLGAGSLSNTVVGASALAANTTGTLNTAVGYYSLISNKTGEQNTAVGTSALAGNTAGNYNVALGINSLSQNTSGSSNTAVGASSLLSNKTGTDNTAIGLSALYYNTASQLTAVGSGALTNNTSGIQNTAVGYSALAGNTAGTNNTALGWESLLANTGNYNTGVGAGALGSNTSGTNNTAVGNSSLQYGTTGSNNTAVGSASLFYNTTGSNNICLGYQAGTNPSSSSPTNYSNCIIIGNSIFPSNSGQAIIGDGTQTSMNFVCSNNPTMSGYTVPSSTNNSTNIATTAWVQSAISGGGVMKPTTWILNTGNIGATGQKLNNGQKICRYYASTSASFSVAEYSVVRFEFQYSVYGITAYNSSTTTRTAGTINLSSLPTAPVNNPNTITYFDMIYGYNGIDNTNKWYIANIQTTSNYWNTQQTYYPKNATTTPYTFTPFKFTQSSPSSNPQYMNFYIEFPQNPTIGGSNCVGDMATCNASLRIVSSTPTTAGNVPYSSNFLTSTNETGSWYFSQ
jgi:hypothetical protein